MTEPPQIVQAANQRAEELDFDISCEPGVGLLLAVLAAAVPANGRILELGTGAGVGLSWLVSGLRGRTDVEVVSVDIDPKVLERVAADSWPDFVRLELGEGGELVDRLGKFNLVFPDEPGSKFDNFEGSIAALRAGGVLVLDDLYLIDEPESSYREPLIEMRDQVLQDARLVEVDLPTSSGILLATRLAESAA